MDRLWGVCDTPLHRGLRPSTSSSAPVPCRGHLGGVCFCALQTGLRPSTPSPVSVPCRGHLGGVCNTPLQAGMALGPPFSFSFLDERKGGKRKSRRQGRRPNLLGTGCVYVMYRAHFPSPGRSRQGRRPNLSGTGRGCVYPPPLNGLMRSVIQVCGAAEGACGVGEGRYGACLGLKWSTYHLLI